MEEYLNRVVEGLSRANPLWAYGALALSAFVENVIPPVPGDTVVVFSAYLVGRGALSWWPVYLATCAGGTLGFMLMYYLGYSRGRALFSGRRFFSPARAARARAWLGRYGMWLVLANRFLSGVRSVIALTAGAGRMDWRRVALGALFSMAVWNGLLLYGGLMLGRNWGALSGYMQQYNRVLLSLLALGGLWFLWRRWRRGRP